MVINNIQGIELNETFLLLECGQMNSYMTQCEEESRVRYVSYFVLAFNKECEQRTYVEKVGCDGSGMIFQFLIVLKSVQFLIHNK